MKIGIACDHAGFEMKEYLKKALVEGGHEIVDFGADSGESVDYPDYAHPLACAVENGDVIYGISLCYSGNGINMAMNKHKGLRAALCWCDEIAVLARRHNNANACSLPAHFITFEQALNIVNVFIGEQFDGGRHQRRIEKIPIIS